MINELKAKLTSIEVKILNGGAVVRDALGLTLLSPNLLKAREMQRR